jgi:opacity protein-like surface antigen
MLAIAFAIEFFGGVMKKVYIQFVSLLVLLAGLIASAPAAVNGFYAGGYLGYGNRDQAHGDFFPFDSSVKDEGMAMRAVLGYQPMHFLALESDFTVQTKDFFSDNYQNDLGLSVKGILPLPGPLSVYGKAGAAYVWQDEEALRPSYGLGAALDLSQHTAIDVNWTRIIGSSDDVRDSNTLLVGLVYYFGSV